MDSRRVLKQIFIGIAVYALVFMVLGFIFMRPIWLFEVSLFAGAIAACFLAYNMYDVLDRALDLESHKAKGFVTVRSLLRLAVCLVLMTAGVMLGWTSFVGVTVGLLGLKVSAFINPLIKKITGDIPVSDSADVTANDTPEEASNEDDESHYEDPMIEKYFKKYMKVKDRYR